MTNFTLELKPLVRLSLFLLGLGGGILLMVSQIQTVAAETPELQTVPPVQKAPEIPSSNNQPLNALGGGKITNDSGPIGAAAPAVNNAPSTSGPDSVDKLFAKGSKGGDAKNASAVNGTEYVELINRIVREAAKGEPEAEYRLGAYYYNGINSNEYKVFTLSKSGDKLNTSLGMDRSMTVHWWTKSAMGGNPMAAEALAEYYSPSGVEPLRYLSMAWYLKAAQLGYASAQHMLGSTLIGFSNDAVERNRFNNQFPKPGSPAHQKILDILPEFTNFPTSSKELYNQGFEWLKRASDSGYFAAQRDLAIDLNTEKSPNFNRKEAYRLFDILVEKRETIVFLHYALSLINDGDSKEDYQKAAELLQQAVDMGENRAYRGLAVINARGLGVPPSPSRAFLYINKCAELVLDYCGDVMASGYSYGSRTLGIRQDLDLAFYWARKLALNGSPVGYQYLSSLYFSGTKERPKNVYLSYLYRRMMGRDDEVDGFQNSRKLYAQLTPEERTRANEFLVKWKPSDPLPE